MRDGGGREEGWSSGVAAEPTADTTMRGARWMRGKKKKQTSFVSSGSEEGGGVFKWKS